jgi:RHS repeat-associated protein
LTDSTGAVVERCAYAAYGATTILNPTATTVRATSSVGNPYMYTGRRLDPEFASSSGDTIYYYRARYYDPQQGRFIGRDSLEYIDGYSTYMAYFATKQGMDPTGLGWLGWVDCCFCGAALAAKLGAGFGGCMAFCESTPNMTYGECVSKCIESFYSPDELEKQFDENPAEWIGAAACVSCGVHAISKLLERDEPAYDPTKDPGVDWEDDDGEVPGHEDKEYCDALMAMILAAIARGDYDTARHLKQRYDQVCVDPDDGGGDEPPPVVPPDPNGVPIPVPIPQPIPAFATGRCCSVDALQQYEPQRYEPHSIHPER